MADEPSCDSLSALKNSRRLMFPEIVSSPKQHEDEEDTTKNDVVLKLGVSDSRTHPKSPPGVSITDLGSAIAQKERSFRGTQELEGRVSRNDDARADYSQELAMSLLGLDDKEFLENPVQSGLDQGGPTRRSLEILVVDETALIGGSVSVPKPAKIADEKAAKRPRKKAPREAKRVCSEVANCGALWAYSREAMEAMRFENVAEQRRMWKDVHLGLGPAVRKEYEDLLASRQPKNIRLNFDHSRRGTFVGKKDQPPSVFGVFAAKGRLNTVNVSVN